MKAKKRGEEDAARTSPATPTETAAAATTADTVE
jgi:hypothetical protein